MKTARCPQGGGTRTRAGRVSNPGRRRAVHTKGLERALWTGEQQGKEAGSPRKGLERALWTGEQQGKEAYPAGGRSPAWLGAQPALVQVSNYVVTSAMHVCVASISCFRLTDGA